jgi:tRNA pseudouridine32 synthase/23S rRNA pseudouridine746 synthase
VIPSGPYVTQCLLNRLKLRTSNPFLTPLNRIDRETAGIVIFSTNRDTRGIYHDLFMGARVEKHYEAITACSEAPSQSQWTIQNRLVQGEPFFRMTTAPGPPNSKSLICCIDQRCGKALFHVRPVTGKKHQIRVHLSNSGYGILNDRYYPDLLPEQPPDHSRPLQLIARSLVFSDPLTGKTMSFTSPRRLSESWLP